MTLDSVSYVDRRAQIIHVSLFQHGQWLIVGPQLLLGNMLVFHLLCCFRALEHRVSTVLYNDVDRVLHDYEQTGQLPENMKEID